MMSKLLSVPCKYCRTALEKEDYENLRCLNCGTQTAFSREHFRGVLMDNFEEHLTFYPDTSLKTVWEKTVQDVIHDIEE